jgi:hypothetical protein
MYISNLTHFLDEEGNIAQAMQREGRKMAAFLAMVVDACTTMHPLNKTDINIRCFKRGCHGRIIAELRFPEMTVHWECPSCANAGIISGWEKTKWDNITV